MTDAMLEKVLKETQAKSVEPGEWSLEDGRRLTLYASHDGVALTISRVEGLRLGKDGLLVARNDKGERYFVALEDLFAVAAEGSGGGSGAGRKAGFL